MEWSCGTDSESLWLRVKVDKGDQTLTFSQSTHTGEYSDTYDIKEGYREVRYLIECHTGVPHPPAINHIPPLTHTTIPSWWWYNNRCSRFHRT